MKLFNFIKSALRELLAIIAICTTLIVVGIILCLVFPSSLLMTIFGSVYIGIGLVLIEHEVIEFIDDLKYTQL